MEPEQYWQQQLDDFLAGKLSPPDETAFRHRLTLDPDLQQLLDRRLDEALDQTLRNEAEAARFRREIAASRQTMLQEGDPGARRYGILWLTVSVLLLAGLGAWWLSNRKTATPDNKHSPVPELRPVDTIPAAPRPKTGVPNQSAPARPKSGPPPVAEHTPAPTTETRVGASPKQAIFTGDLPLQSWTLVDQRKQGVPVIGTVPLQVLPDLDSQPRYRFSGARLTLLVPTSGTADFARFGVLQLREAGEPARFYLHDDTGKWFPIVAGGKNFSELVPETDPNILDLLRQN